jgi:hypothetical protein
MNLRSFVSLLLLLPALALVAGCGAGYDVLRASPTTPIAPPHAFVVLPTSYDGVSMFKQTMEAYAAGLDAEKRSGLASDQAVFDQSFLESLNLHSAGHWTFQNGPAVPAGGLGVRVHIEKIGRWMAKGYLAGTIAIVGPDNQTLDEIRIDTSMGGAWQNAVIMGGGGKTFGELFAQYLAKRSGG